MNYEPVIYFCMLMMYFVMLGVLKQFKLIMQQRKLQNVLREKQHESLVQLIEMQKNPMSMYIRAISNNIPHLLNALQAARK